MRNENLMLKYTSMAIFALLPIFYVFSFPFFLVALVISGVVIQGGSRDDKILKTLIWAGTFTSLGIGQFKLIDLIVVAVVLVMFLSGRVLKFPTVMLGLLVLMLYLSSTFAVRWVVWTNPIFLKSMNVEWMRYLLSALATILVLQLNLNTKNISNWLDRFVGLIGLQAVVMLIIQIANKMKYTGVFGPIHMTLFLEEGEERISAFFTDPNKFMTYVLLLLSIRVVMVIMQGNKVRWEWPFVLYLIVGTLSLSRTSVIVDALVLSLVVFFGLAGRNKDNVLSKLMVVFGLVGTAVTLFYQQVLSYASSFFKDVLILFGRTRTAEIDASVTEDSRVIVWEKAIKLIHDDFLLGHGLGSSKITLGMATHNTFIQLLFEAGIVGAVLFVMMFWIPVAKKTPIWVAFPLILVPQMFLDLCNFRMSYVFLGVVYLLMLRDGGIGQNEASDIN